MRSASEEVVEDEKKQKNMRTGLIIGIVSVLVLLAVIYIGIGLYFQSHFYPGTTINEINFSLADAGTAEDKVREEAEDYLLAVHDREDRVTYINGEQMDYHYESDGSIAKLMEAQNAMLWPMSIRGAHDYKVNVKLSYDEGKLMALLEGMECFKKENIVEPEDAYLEYTENGYEIIPEKKGNQPLKEQIMLDVKAAIEAREQVLILDDDDYVQPAVTADDPKLTEKLAVAEKYRNMSITYEIDGYDQVLDGQTILSWITIEDDLSVKVDENMAASYAQQLASKYNTYADVRSFKTSLGDTIEIGGGDYGWIVDKPSEAAQIVEDIKKGESVKREPCYEQRAFVTGTNDIGSTYIEIDYTQQHLWFYKNGELVVESDLVSGNINNGNGSPDGVFKIITRKSPAVLSGEDYESEVTYFLPFAYNVGLHDADWRSSFGGNIYKGGGSHGCVNLPFKTAETLYNQAETGTPVIAFYRENVKLTSNNAKVSNAYSYSN